MAGSAVLAQPTITNLGVLAGGSGSYGQAISADGLVVTGSSGTASGGRAFRWTAATGMQSLGGLSGTTYTSGASLSMDGSVIVGQDTFSGGSERAFRWTAATGILSLGVLGSGSGSAASAVNADGSVAAGFSYVSGFTGATAMRWTAATGMQSLGQAGNAFGISGDGSVIAGINGDNHAFRWTAATGMQDLGILVGADSSAASAVSVDGSTIVGTSSDQLTGAFTHAFRWTAATGMQDLGAPGGGASQAFAVNGDGSMIAGTQANPSGPDRAILWTSSWGWVDLNVYLPSVGVNLAGWTLTSVQGISADGSAMTGNGSFNGQDRAWLLSGLVAACYANCDASTVAPVLNVNDFQCFLNRFAAGSSYANCDGSTVAPALNVNDFVCFLNAFATGCP
jgi:probable HAF family extracellular repeat protein